MNESETNNYSSHEPKINKVRTKVANTLEVLAWTLEVFVVMAGLAIAVALTFQGYSEFNFLIFISSTLILGLLAIFELVKIPTAQLFVSEKKFTVRLICILVLFGISFTTFETMYQGVELLQHQRKQVIRDQEMVLQSKKAQANSLRKKLELIPDGVKKSISQEELRIMSLSELERQELELSLLNKKISTIIENDNLQAKILIEESLKQASKDLEKADILIARLSEELRKDIKVLNTQLTVELEKSFFRDKQVTKEANSRIDKRGQRFNDEKKVLLATREELGRAQKDLRSNLMQLTVLSAGAELAIQDLKDQRAILQGNMSNLRTSTRATKITNVNALKNKEILRDEFLENLITLDDLVQLATADLIFLKEQNVIFRIAGYLFQKEVHEISTEEFSFFNHIFISSMALIIATIPFLIAGLSTAIKIQHSTAKTKNPHTILETAKSFYELREASQVTNLKVKAKNDTEYIRELKIKVQKLKSHSLSQDQTAKGLQGKVEREERKNSRLTEQLSKKPKHTVEKIVETIESKPEIIYIPVPDSWEGGNNDE